MIERLLIANRGEIACRILRTCRKLGIASVCVFTEVDQGSLWVEQADVAYRVSSYLAMDELLEAARITRADAVHPGFGFLAENAEFARRVEGARLVWVGPSPESMEKLADKGAARQLAQSLRIPVLTSDGKHFPLMIKAAAGGGGKGMRLVYEREQLAEAETAARSEALRSFGDDRLIYEKALLSARHVEVQIFGDGQGNVIHLGERDCSLQRRHQKILEESPALDVDCTPLYEAALKIGQAVHYRNAGTVEFLVQDGDFYFLEVNTRLQVEHPVTEAVTGLDLVELQIRLAEGEPLPEPPVRTGHAIEVRLCAENNLGMPSTGTVLDFHVDDPEVRLETGLRSGDSISPHYDSMVAKLIVHAPTRDEAFRKLRRALERTSLLGVESNRDLLLFWAGHEGPWTTTTHTEGPMPEDDWAQQAARPSALASDLTLRTSQGPWVWLERDGYRRRFRVVYDEQGAWVASDRAITRLIWASQARRGLAQGAGHIQAPLTGTVLRLQVQVGDKVSAGQVLLHLEAMKMEHRLSSPHDGVVAELTCSEGQVVNAGTLLLHIAPPGGES